jgi:hypothetical protein
MNSFNNSRWLNELLEKLNSISGINIPKDALAKRPSFSLSNIKDSNDLEQLIKVFDWAFKKLRLRKTTFLEILVLSLY